MLLIEGLLLGYLLVTTGAMALTWNEHLQGPSQGGALGVTAGLLACTVWPLVFAAILLELRRRG